MLRIVYWFLSEKIVNVKPSQKGELMKTMLLMISLFFSSMAFAQKTSPDFSYSMPAIEAGFKWNTAKIVGSTSDKQEVGFQLGISTVLNFSSNIGLRSGMFYSERPFASEIGGLTVKGKISYFEVPAQLMFKFEEYAGVYVGPSFSVKLGDEVSGGNTLTDAKSFITPLTFGAQFKFVPNLGANVFFETVPGDLANGVSNSRAVGVNLLFTLD